MSRRDILILIACTVVIIGVFVVVLGRGHSSTTTGGPQPPHVTPVNPNFDTQTISKIQQNFPVNLDLSGLGRQDPFAGI